MENRLVVEVFLMRQQGWTLPKFRFATGPHIPGVLHVKDEAIPSLNRSARVARLHDVHTGFALDIPRPLIDATLIYQSAEDWVLTGFEQIDDGLRVLDYAQSWYVRPVRIIDSEAS